MLSKLIRYEFRSTRRYYLPIYAALILVALLTMLLRMTGGDRTSTGVVIAISAYILLLLALAALTFVVIIIRFYRNLLGPEGYLMFTLPVSAGQNIFGKLIPSFCWSIGSLLLAGLTIVLMSDAGFIRKLQGDFSGLSPQTWIFLGGLLLSVLLLGAGAILFFYLCMAIGQLFNEHKFLASVGAYLVLEMVLQVLAILLAIPLLDKAAQWVFDANCYLTVGSSLLGSGALVLCSFLICLVLFLLTRWLLEKKLNLS